MKIIGTILSRTCARNLLLVAAGVAVVFACLGADRALDVMKYYAAIATVGALAVVLGFVALRSLVRLVRAHACSRISVAALLLHLGLAAVLGGWTYNEVAGVPGGYLQLRAGQTGSVGGAFNLTLRRFTIDRWEDTGTIRQYTSDVCVLPPEATEPDVRATEDAISVNHPLVKDGWWVYQSSYEEAENPHTGQPFYFTVLDCVKDVGLPIVFVGGLLLLLGALAYVFPSGGAGAPRSSNPAPAHPCLRAAFALVFAGAVAMVVHRSVSTGHPPLQNMYEFLLCAAALIPVLTFFSLRRGEHRALLVDAALEVLVMIPVAFVMDGRVKHLMPALQSPFFVPHVGAYVLGYLVLVRAALGVGKNLAGLGFFLLTLGLVLGATWGKVCWGHWWQFDPKEMWSLATWFVYAAWFHVRARLSSRADRLYLLAGAVMIVLTLTWINLSRLFTGMHSYA